MAGASQVLEKLCVRNVVNKEAAVLNSRTEYMKCFHDIAGHIQQKRIGNLCA